MPSPNSWPRGIWSHAQGRRPPSRTGQPASRGDPRGTAELRDALATYLGRVRGVNAAPEHIVICAGFAHGLAILAKAMHAMGIDTVAMEDPCLPAHRAIVRDQGLRIAALPVDAQGAHMATANSQRAGAALVTPAHQYPTGVTLSPQRRMQLVAWAQQDDRFVIEDDYDGEFRYDRQPVGALQGLDRDRVVYAGTTSKTLAPGIRIGWLVLPPRLVEPVIESTRHGGAMPSALQQLALAHLLATGQLDRHLRRLRISYRSRRDRLIAALAQAVPALAPTGIAAGLHLLLYLTDTKTSEVRVRAVAEKHGIALAYMGSHWHQPDGRAHGVIVGYSRPSTSSFDDAVHDLAGVLREAVATDS